MAEFLARSEIDADDEWLLARDSMMGQIRAVLSEMQASDCPPEQLEMIGKAIGFVDGIREHTVDGFTIQCQRRARQRPDVADAGKAW